MNGKRQNQSSYERMRRKKAERRRRHVDKYAERASGTQADTKKPGANDERR